MLGIKDWVFSQLVTKSVVSSSSLTASDRYFVERPPNEEMSNQVPEAADTSLSLHNPENGHQGPPGQVQVETSLPSRNCTNKKLGPLEKIEGLQIKFMRLLQRLGYSQDNLVVAKVLYRIYLATLIRAEESDLKRTNLRTDRARKIAAEQEAAGDPELDFSFRVLVLGRSGVGKSATINSVFDQTKAATDAFQPATNHIQEIVGTVNGIKITFIDTPGLLPLSANTFRRNRKILSSVKRFIKKSPPDMVLYFERLDLINAGYSDFPLLKLITEAFGSSIWFNTILVMTHSSCPTGYPLSFESYVSQCTSLMQHYIHQVVSDSKLENPVILVENHPHCRTDVSGERVLPNGQVWRSQFLLICLCTKILGDANSILQLRDSIALGPSGPSRLPSLPHLLSSFLRQHAVVVPNGADDAEEFSFSDSDEEDDYDQLPPIRILTKSQFEKLSKLQKKDYLDELDYREVLYMKKQLKEESRRKRESKLRKDGKLPSDDSSDNQEEPPEPVQLPDMAVPPSFDSDCPLHRYRCLVAGDQWLARPVLDPHGWDHDVGFDGINLEIATEIKNNIFASVTGQMSKEKHDFNVQSEWGAAYLDPRGPTYSVGLNVQSSGKDMIYTLHSDAKLRYLKSNVAECGVSATSFGDKYYIGAKVGDSLLVGKRLKLVANGGFMNGQGQLACGGNLGASLMGRDYPVRDDKFSVNMTVLSFNKETVLGCGIESDFRASRGTKVSVSANLNSRKTGQVCVKTNSSDHVEIALIAVVAIFRGLLRRKSGQRKKTETA